MKRFKLGTPHRYKLANGNNHLCAVLAKVDLDTAQCEHIEPIIYPSFSSSNLED